MSNQSNDGSDIERRRFLQWTGGVLLLASGCGGGGSSNPSPTPTPSPTPVPDANPVLSSDSRLIPIEGGTLADTSRGIVVTVPPGALSEPTSGTLTIRRDPHSQAPPLGFDISPNLIELQFNSDKLQLGQFITLQIPWSWGFDLIGTGIYATSETGELYPLDIVHNPGSQTLQATISKREFEAFNPSRGRVSLFAAGARIAPARHKTLAPLLRPAPPQRTRLASPKQIAIVVHGILNTGADVLPVKSYLRNSEFRLPVIPGEELSVTGQVYDYVDNDWSYDWLHPISENAGKLATYINQNYSNAEVIDIYAHSMGGLVSRYAIEKLGLDSRINQLITFGTPHKGVPLRALRLFLLIVFPKAYNAIEAGLELVGWTGLLDLLENSDFLLSLNNNQEPPRREKYRCLAGDSFADFKGILGNIVDLLYTVVIPGVKHDGIVPITSALAASDSLRIVHYNHSQIIDNLGPTTTRPDGYQIDNWVVAPVRGTVR